MPAPRTDERWFVSTLSDPGAKLRVLAGKPIGESRLVKEFDTPEEAEAAVREHNDRLNEKGPASAPTLPDHDPNNPCKENAVSNQQRTTAPVDPAMPCPVLALAFDLKAARERTQDLDEKETKARRAGNDSRTAYFANAHRHAYKRERALQDVIAATKATSVPGAIVQLVEALSRFDLVADAVPNRGIGSEVEEDTLAANRLVWSALGVLTANSGQSLDDLMGDFASWFTNPWIPVEERIAALEAAK